MAKQRVDVYPNRALQQVIMTGANALTYGQMRFGFGAFAGSALILHRIEWFPDVTALQGLIAATDEIQMAITNRDDLAALTPDQMNVLILKQLSISLVGAVTSLWQDRLPLVSDLSTLPGGGLIVPANPLFIGCGSAGLGAAVTLDAIVYYTIKQLADADYIELIQSLIPVNI